MEKVILETDDVIKIANAIRDKTGSKQTMKINQMPSMISGISTNNIEYCQVTFPESCLGETIYYTNKSGEFTQFINISNTIKIIEVMKNTIITSDMNNLFDGNTYILPGAESCTPISTNGYKNALVVHCSFTFEYSDNAPA